MVKLTSLKTEKRLLDRQAADLIREHILNGTLPAGARLLETKLSTELEVSRGTVRAALAVLVREGLVQQVAFTRWQVAETSAVDAWELYTLRAALEGMAARMAAESLSARDRESLRLTGEEMAKAAKDGRLSDVTDIDFRLHREIVALAHHGRLAEQHGYILQQVRFHMVHSGFIPQNYDALVEEHRVLIDAVTGGNSDRAERLARMHNEAEVKLLSRFAEANRRAANS